MRDPKSRQEKEMGGQAEVQKAAAASYSIRMDSSGDQFVLFAPVPRNCASRLNQYFQSCLPSFLNQPNSSLLLTHIFTMVGVFHCSNSLQAEN